jgi:hypothetical protein
VYQHHNEQQNNSLLPDTPQKQRRRFLSWEQVTLETLREDLLFAIWLCPRSAVAAREKNAIGATKRHTGTEALLVGSSGNCMCQTSNSSIMNMRTRTHHFGRDANPAAMISCNSNVGALQTQFNVIERALSPLSTKETLQCSANVF